MNTTSSGATSQKYLALYIILRNCIQTSNTEIDSMLK
jgi:hypothetical protein